MMLKKVSTLSDNYVWMLYDSNKFCIIIDPGESKPILNEIKRQNWFPVAILLTHNHIDHTNGVKKIVKSYPKIVVYGPYETKKCGTNKIIKDGDIIYLLKKNFYVFFTPGHTLGHITYYQKPYLFCGDTVFSAGCGRVYRKNYLYMYNSIKIISSFPENTFLCCSHEYTVRNLLFSMSIIKKDKIIKNYYNKIKKLNCSLPSYILHEKKINLFLRTHEDELKDAMGLKSNCTSFEVFLNLRLKKDNFWS